MPNAKNHLVSIMMPAYNAEQYIGQAIESVLAQSYPHWELIVVNDGSTDETATVAARYADSRIKLIHQPNGGESVARNTALDNMQGNYVAFLDADDLYLPHHLQIAVTYLQMNPDCDGVYTDGYYCDQDTNIIQTLQSWRRGPFEGRVFEEVVRAPDVFGPPVCVVLRRSLITRHNLTFDPNIVIGPDWDFFTRFSALATFGYVDQPTCLYRVHQTNISFQTSSQRRAFDLATCRMKAVQLKDFSSCSAETRTAVFYDLLVSLLSGSPERQSAILEWSQFKDLPAENQARLCRLMASKAIRAGTDDGYAKEWLRRSRTLNPSDVRGTIVALLFDMNPGLCRWVLRARSLAVPKRLKNSPFGTLE